MSRKLLPNVLWLLCLALLTVAARAATLPAGFSESLVASGLTQPTAMTLAPDGRVFVCEQGGTLRVIKNGAKLAAPFVSLNVDTNGERGLLGVALDPNFAANSYVYLYYTATTPTIHNRVSRFTANGDVAVAGSERVLIDLEPLFAIYHNGGGLNFGRDGKLYIAVGDNTNSRNAQTLTSRFGKILRLNADGSIPADNPFFTQATGDNRAIWAWGVRNPFTFAVQPGTGRIFINDVGQDTWEEINEGRAGANYGWPTTEGPTSDARFTSPIFYYGHGSGPTTGCSIAGGAFYNPATVQFPTEYAGQYFFADYCSGWIRRLDPATRTVMAFAAGAHNPVDLKVSASGALLYLSRGDGAVRKIEYGANRPPSISSQPSDRTVSTGQAATFSVGAVGGAPLAYQWQRNGVNISGAIASSYTLASASTADSGARFGCIVSNPYGGISSYAALLTVTSNRPPIGSIAAPGSGTLYRAGDTISYSGSASDPEDGTLPASAFTWQVDFHHDTHLHPFLAAISGRTNGSFVIPRSGETSPNVWYRIILTVRDAQGLTHSSFRDVRPRTASVTLATNPPGLQITLDGQPHPAPFTFSGVAGMTRTLGAPAQTLNGAAYEWVSWSDGGAATHDISTPDAGKTFTANFRAVGDLAPPRVTITTPRFNTSYSNDYPLAQAAGTAGDDLSGISSVTARLFRHATTTHPAGYWNGGTWDAAYNDAAHELRTVGRFNWSLLLPALEDGKYELRVRARDNAGNVGDSAVTPFFIDNQAPQIFVSMPTAGAAYSSLTQASGTARDSGPGVAAVRGVLQRAADGTFWNGSTWTAARTEVPATGRTSWTWTFPPLEAGTYSFQAIAIDFVGNRGTSPVIEFSKAP